MTLREARECKCGHSKYVHFITAKGDRGRCSSWHGGRCQCRGFTKDETDANPSGPAPR